MRRSKWDYVQKDDPGNSYAEGRSEGGIASDAYDEAHVYKDGFPPSPQEGLLWFFVSILSIQVTYKLGLLFFLYWLR